MMKKRLRRKTDAKTKIIKSFAGREKSLPDRFGLLFTVA